MTRIAYASPGAVAVGPYSHAVDSGELIFFSGQTPIDTATGLLKEGGIPEQTKQCFVNLFSVLEAAGLSQEDVVKVNVYLTDMGSFKAMNEVYEKQFSAPFPARTTIGVASLPLGASIEIEMIAKRRSK
ncbi:RidA family protein [Acidaminobacter hydrogenoformans]|uniref:2-iminobutanoate/2-iminopropanoate deaminase n=1 Tax=Acidaminobacter hydrogenoformans DSM 2784 TaxID=1120920 RepID=A0A1G5RXZ1_9FIRM|nr:Rid family detoxifying hydrolase [Acidaminobacter hydrogenoformans]SCZ78787.1 2-iminobutanoate/2-iminopropanoate deaminase [Acidaminobacter hydrogenoformans DSM 2784]